LAASSYLSTLQNGDVSAIAGTKAQLELAEIAREIDAGLKGGVYRATQDELAGIDRGLEAARNERFATDRDVEGIFAKHRRA
jgi:hypothetical protein